eukprot:scaffold19256_cov128-Isochrysis_galbana.AAC.1
MGGTAHQLTAAYGGSMRGPAEHPSLRHPMTFRYVQPRPPSARRKPATLPRTCAKRLRLTPNLTFS